MNSSRLSQHDHLKMSPKELTSEHQTSWQERGGHKSFGNTERHPGKTEGEQRQEGEERALSVPGGARPPPQHPGGSTASPTPGRAPHTRHCDTSVNQQLPPIRQAPKVFSIKEYNQRKLSRTSSEHKQPSLSENMPARAPEPPAQPPRAQRQAPSQRPLGASVSQHRTGTMLPQKQPRGQCLLPSPKCHGSPAPSQRAVRPGPARPPRTGCRGSSRSTQHAATRSSCWGTPAERRRRWHVRTPGRCGPHTRAERRGHCASRTVVPSQKPGVIRIFNDKSHVQWKPVKHR